MDTVKNKEESDPRKNLWSASAIGAFRTPFLPDLGWKVISHKKGGGKREIKVQIRYSHSLKRHHFSESRSYLGRESLELVFPGKICGLP